MQPDGNSRSRACPYCVVDDCKDFRKSRWRDAQSCTIAAGGPQQWIPIVALESERGWSFYPAGTLNSIGRGLTHLWGLPGLENNFLGGWECIGKDQNLSWSSVHSMYCRIVAYIHSQRCFSCIEYMCSICPVSPPGAWCKVLQYIPSMCVTFRQLFWCLATFDSGSGGLSSRAVV